MAKKKKETGQSRAVISSPPAAQTEPTTSENPSEAPQPLSSGTSQIGPMAEDAKPEPEPEPNLEKATPSEEVHPATPARKRGRPPKPPGTAMADLSSTEPTSARSKPNSKLKPNAAPGGDVETSISEERREQLRAAGRVRGEQLKKDVDHQRRAGKALVAQRGPLYMEEIGSRGHQKALENNPDLSTEAGKKSGQVRKKKVQKRGSVTSATDELPLPPND